MQATRLRGATRIVSVSSARGNNQCVDGVVEFSVRAVRGDEFSRAHATIAERRTGTSLVPHGGSSSIDYKVLEVHAVRAGGRGTSRRAQMPGSGRRLCLPTAGPTHVLWRREALPRGAAAARGRVERRIGRLFVVALGLRRSAAARGRARVLIAATRRGDGVASALARGHGSGGGSESATASARTFVEEALLRGLVCRARRPAARAQQLGRPRAAAAASTTSRCSQ